MQHIELSLSEPCEIQPDQMLDILGSGRLVGRIAL